MTVVMLMYFLHYTVYSKAMKTVKRQKIVEVFFFNNAASLSINTLGKFLMNAMNSD